MPASPYLMEQSNLNGGQTSSSTATSMAPTQGLTSPTEQLALQLALLQGGLHSDFDATNGVNGHSGQPCMIQSGFRESLEDLKMPMPQRKSQNMTECVPVPTSEHVAEIVGRQGCKIKALRAKTNTYIKTPVRGEEPVFVVTGRKEDVSLAKREILSAADHFSQIRASRKGNINSTLAFGQLVANQPGQTTQQVRVPYRVVGLVVGPKGATIKRIQQQTRTYIVTPSRDKEPIFEVTGLPENVEVARKEIEAHIAFRTGSGEAPPGSSDSGSTSGFYTNLNDVNGDDNVFSSTSGMFGSVGTFERGGSGFDHLGSNRQQTEANGSSSLFGSDRSSMMGGSGFNGCMNDSGHQNKGITLQNILDSNNFDLIANDMRSGATNVSAGRLFNESSTTNGWGDSQDSGISGSPPFDKQRPGLDHPSGSGVWGELNKALGGMKIHEPERSTLGQQTPNSNQQQLVTRASVDLGTLGRPQAVPLTSSNSLTLIGALTTAASESDNTANSISSSVMVPSAGSGSGNGYLHHQPVIATSSTGSSSVASLSDMSPPNSLPHYLSSETRASLNLGGNFLEDQAQTATEENNLKKLMMIQNAELLRKNELNEKKSSFD